MAEEIDYFKQKLKKEWRDLGFYYDLGENKEKTGDFLEVEKA